MTARGRVGPPVEEAEAGMRRPMWAVVSGAAFFLLCVTAAHGVGRRADATASVGLAGTPVAHAAAMTCVLALTAGAATLLLRAGWRLSAGLVALGATIGPLALLSPPWSASVTAGGGGPTAPPLARAGIGVAAALWILGTAWLMARPPAPTSSYAVASFGVPFALVGFGLLSVPDALSDPGHEDLGYPMVLGWSLLSAGVAAAGLVAARQKAGLPRWPAAVLLPTACAAVVGGMYAAYNNPGGRPIVAGWDLGTPPTYATVATGVTLVLSGLVAPAATVCARARARPRTSPSRSAARFAGQPATSAHTTL